MLSVFGVKKSDFESIRFSKIPMVLTVTPTDLKPSRMAISEATGIEFKSVGVTDNTIGIFENLMDSKSLFLTPNTESIYAGTWLDLSKGPVVVESPPNTLGIVDDMWFRYVADLGNAGPDQGRGGRFLFIPPGYDGPVPLMGFHVFQSKTFNNVLIWRGFLVDDSPKLGVENIKKNARIYPLASIKNPPKQIFINLSGNAVNTIHANDYTFFEEINMAIQEEPAGSGDPELLGSLRVSASRKVLNLLLIKG